MSLAPPTFRPEDCRILSRETLWQGLFSVDRVTLEHARLEGRKDARVERIVFERGDSVGVLPYDPTTDTVVLVEQLRAGALRDEHSPWLREIIAGVVEPGEHDEAVARREADEEAGAQLGELLPIATYYPSPGACSERVQLFCARLLTAGDGGGYGRKNEAEDIRVHTVAREDAIAALDAGWVTSSLTLIALQWLALNADALRNRWNGPGPTTTSEKNTLFQKA